MEIIDLSQTISPGGYARPFHPTPEIWPMLTHEESRERFGGKFSFQAKAFKLSDHSSTHVDAINHFDPAPDAPSIDQLPLSLFITGALCVDLSKIPARTFIEPEHIEGELSRHKLAVERGDTFLYHTGHYERYFADPEKWWTEFAGLSRGAAEFLADRGVVNVGCEAFTIENPATMVPEAPEPYPAHQVCKEHRMLNTENLVIPKRLVGKRFRFLGLPLKLRGGTGSPIRAVAWVED
ncbi:MAG: cyclase family protein [Nitrospinota bacterium]